MHFFGIFFCLILLYYYACKVMQISTNVWSLTKDANMFVKTPMEAIHAHVVMDIHLKKIRV